MATSACLVVGCANIFCRRSRKLSSSLMNGKSDDDLDGDDDDDR